MNTLFRKTLLATALIGAVASASAAVTFPDFVVNELGVAGTSPNTFTADKITGNFVEVISFNGSGSGTFDVALKWNAGQFVGNDGSQPQSSQLNNFGSAGYGLYALYNGQGTFNTVGNVTDFNFISGGTLRLFTDALKDTVLTEPTSGTGSFGATGTDDDVLIAVGMPLSGAGTLDRGISTCGDAQGINCGSFGASSTLDLTEEGSQFFTSPQPFYNLAFQSGQLNNFTPVGTQRINGSLDVAFNSASTDVPEPGSLALIGLGLAAVALVRRRKAKQA